MKSNNTKGFTLIELLVVIAIVAILAVVVILTLNPAELLRQARDSNRLSDLGTMKSAISMTLADVTSPTIVRNASYSFCYESASSTTIGANCGFTGTYTATTSTSTAVDGTGWLPVVFTAISSGAPIGNLPLDPVNSGDNVYTYVASSTLVFEINARLESTKYTTAGTGAESTDGGNNSSAYETGTAPGLSL